MFQADATPFYFAEASMTANETDMASSVHDLFPPVFATARMIALMELAAARCLLPLLESDGSEESVGVGVDVTHSAPSPLGSRITARATWLGREGTLHRFAVIAEDESGEIGRGTHTRAIVQTRRIVAGAAKRQAAVQPCAAASR